jgi:hypothetical protein
MAPGSISKTTPGTAGHAPSYNPTAAPPELPDACRTNRNINPGQHQDVHDPNHFTAAGN